MYTYMYTYIYMQLLICGCDCEVKSPVNLQSTQNIPIQTQKSPTRHDKKPVYTEFTQKSPIQS